MAAATLSADRVKLRNGKVVDGQVMSADGTSVRMLLPDGSAATFPIADVADVEFTARKSPPAPAPDPAKAPAPITVPAGTVLSVLLTQAIDVDVAQAGMTFRALLDDPVMLGGRVVIPRHSAVLLQAAKVEQAGNFKGADRIILKANSVTFGGRRYDIVTSQVEQKGKGEGKKNSGGRSSAGPALALPPAPSSAAAPAPPSVPRREPPPAPSSPVRARST